MNRTLIRIVTIPAIAALMSFTAAGCSSPLKREAFAQTKPAFDPIDFWTGHTHSWGVIENRDGGPTSIITTTTDGTSEDRNDRSPAPTTSPLQVASLHMVQHVQTGGSDNVRDWHIRRIGENLFEATANDLVGTARGSPSGCSLHWTWTLASKPGNGLYNLSMEQWMYLSDNQTLLVRTVVSKFGIRVAEISEQFVRDP